ncbi:MAG: TetR/AcrR family transcriptional regulator, partial [Methanobacterium sp.]
MSEETKEIILSAALKVFSEEGYVGAKTRLIAEEAGFSEMTLFRKFRSKENLFDTVLMEQKALILNEVSALSRENKIEDSILSLSYLIRQLYRLIEDYFPYISIYINENRRTSECIL